MIPPAELQHRTGLHERYVAEWNYCVERFIHYQERHVPANLEAAVISLASTLKLAIDAFAAARGPIAETATLPVEEPVSIVNDLPSTRLADAGLDHLFHEAQLAGSHPQAAQGESRRLPGS